MSNWHFEVQTYIESVSNIVVFSTNAVSQNQVSFFCNSDSISDLNWKISSTTGLQIFQWEYHIVDLIFLDLSLIFVIDEQTWLSKF